MIVVPLVALSIARRGLSETTTGAAAIAAITLVPLALVVLRYRGPVSPEADLGRGRGGAGVARAQGLRRSPSGSVALGFALGLTAQVSFFTHQVKLTASVLGATGAGWLVGRLLLAWVADWIESAPCRRHLRHPGARPRADRDGAPRAGPRRDDLRPRLLSRADHRAVADHRAPRVRRGVVRHGLRRGRHGHPAEPRRSGPALYGVARDFLGSYPPVPAIAAGFELAALAVVIAGSRR